MSDTAIEVFDVWKKFNRGETHDSLRDLVPFLAKRLTGRRAGRCDLGDGDFWALKDISFEVRRGEVLGIIGPNGAGKSTMLKILSRILRPNRGWVRVNGRLSALIEVGAGFHPDLTGRENIYLNGTILGMRKAEIHRKFDEIVAFAELDQFLDMPVKRYSSGMYVRLAFAVAAHLEPEILLVDEVLAVGDARFQKKCLNKMQDVGQQGRHLCIAQHAGYNAPVRAWNPAG
jgi:lipopolysaccharide transport system ATP-binding protein